jgi:hypothetical protein
MEQPDTSTENTTEETTTTPINDAETVVDASDVVASDESETVVETAESGDRKKNNVKRGDLIEGVIVRPPQHQLRCLCLRICLGLFQDGN